VARGHAGRVERRVGAGRRVEPPGEGLTDGGEGGVAGPHGAVVLSAVGQARERAAQMLNGVAIEGALALKVRPLPVKGQRDHLALGQGRRRAASSRSREGPLAQHVIHHHVHCG